MLSVVPQSRKSARGFQALLRFALRFLHHSRFPQSLEEVFPEITPAMELAFCVLERPYAILAASGS